MSSANRSKLTSSKISSVDLAMEQSVNKSHHGHSKSLTGVTGPPVHHDSNFQTEQVSLNTRGINLQSGHSKKDSKRQTPMGSNGNTVAVSEPGFGASSSGTGSHVNQ